jgi:hypothetical protein
MIDKINSYQKLLVGDNVKLKTFELDRYRKSDYIIIKKLSIDSKDANK